MAKASGPAYQVIYHALLKKINKGVYRRDVPIPSENELARKYEVSRMTARKSVDMLVAEGYLSREKGRGTFVTGRRKFVRDELSLTARLTRQDVRIFNEVKSLELVTEFPPALLDHEFMIETEPGTQEPREAVKAVQFLLGGEAVEPGEEMCWKIRRLRFVDDRPVIRETVWIPRRFAPDLTEETARGSLVEAVGGQSEPGQLELRCQPELVPKKKLARELGLTKGDLILKVTGTLTYLDGTPALYSESWQNTAALPFALNLQR